MQTRKIVTIGELRESIKDLPDDAKLAFAHDTRIGIAYDWEWDIYLKDVSNWNDCCGICYDALMAPEGKSLPQCAVHSGIHLFIKI